MKTYKSILVAMLLVNSNLFAHGEHKPGPHGGEIRMPGAFHTEAITIGPKDLKVYLLDIQFQSPTTANSSLTARFEGATESSARCKKEADFFTCTFDSEVLNTKGTLYIKSSRENKTGSEVSYSTPLKF